jgi:HD-GYP domain-containing protein (c-di-GMP phosphodiesterase class II)
LSSLEQKIEEISEMKQEASQRYEAAKDNVKSVVEQIAKDDGHFDYEVVDQTVGDLVSFLSRRANAFSYLTHEIFSYDEYLFNHSISVCVIATAVLRRFNDHFGEVINRYLATSSGAEPSAAFSCDRVNFIYYLPDEIHSIAIGYLLHDVGKVMVPDEVLNKNGPLTDEEYKLVQLHSWEFGAQVLKKNGISNPFIENSVKYHHAQIYNGEPRCYPDDRLPIEIAPYVKIGKLADIYDAMTSKRCYRDAVNPIEVVTDVFRSYANKNRLLQFLLYSFVKVIGIYPPGSVLYLRNGQMAYVLDSEGPLVLPISDQDGNRLNAADPIDLVDDKSLPEGFQIDRRRSLKDPKDVWDLLPDSLRKTA